MEHIYGHCCTSPRLRELSGTLTFMNPQMDPKMDPPRLILEDHCRLKALPGPSRVQIDQFFFIDLKTTEKLKNIAWFEVNWTSGCKAIITQICCGPFGPPPSPRIFRVNICVSKISLYDNAFFIVRIKSTLRPIHFFLISISNYQF